MCAWLFLSLENCQAFVKKKKKELWNIPSFPLTSFYDSLTSLQKKSPLDGQLHGCNSIDKIHGFSLACAMNFR